MQYNTPFYNILIGGFPGSYHNYEHAIKSAGCTYCYPITQGNTLLLSGLADLSYDLLLLPGGGDISPSLYMSADISTKKFSESTDADFPLDLLQFQLLQAAFLQKKPILAICKGMQLVNVFFGGDLYPHLPTAETHQSTGSDRMHPLRFSPEFPLHSQIFGRRGDICAKLHKILSGFREVNSAHHQGIRKVGKDLTVLQYSEDFLPETIAHRQLPILGLQWHPERLPGFAPDSFKKITDLLLQSAQL